MELLDITKRLFESHPSVNRAPYPKEIFGTYLFRSALVSLLLVFEYANEGGMPNRSTPRLVNDLADTHFATFATFFDGLLSEDRRLLMLYHSAVDALTAIRSGTRA